MNDDERVAEIFKLRKQWGRFLEARGVSGEDCNTLWNLTLKIFEVSTEP